MAEISTLNGYELLDKDSVRAFATVADMQAATDLAAGMTCHTNGLDSAGDGGAAYYSIGTSGTIACQNGLYATVVVAPVSPDARDMACSPIEVTTVAALAAPSIDHYAQGATADGDGNMYVFWAPRSGTSATATISKYNGTSHAVISIHAFADYTNVGHGNSMAYDPTLGVIVIYSNNKYITMLSTSLEVLKQYSTGSSSHAVSEIAIDADYAITNMTGTDTFFLYKRLSGGIFGMYATCTHLLPRGHRNYLQDAFMYQSCIVSISSASEFDTYLSAIGVNGAYIGTYRIIGINKEMQGGFVIGTTGYLVDSEGTLYSFRMPSIGDVSKATAINPSLEPCYTRSVETSHYNYAYMSNLFELVTGTTTNTSSKYSIARVIPHVDVPFYNRLNMAPERSTLGGFNYFNVASVTNGGLRVEGHYYGQPIRLFYTVSSDKTYQYLSAIALDKDGAERYITIAADGSNFATKIDSVFDTSQAIHIVAPSAGTLNFLPYGINKLGTTEDYFLVLATE